MLPVYLTSYDFHFLRKAKMVATDTILNNYSLNVIRNRNNDWAFTLLLATHVLVRNVKTIHVYVKRLASFQDGHHEHNAKYLKIVLSRRKIVAIKQSWKCFKDVGVFFSFVIGVLEIHVVFIVQYKFSGSGLIFKYGLTSIYN